MPELLSWKNSYNFISESELLQDGRGGRVMQRCWVNFQCQGILLIWIIVGQGPIALEVGAGGVVCTFFLSSVFSLFFLPFSGRRPDIPYFLGYKTEFFSFQNNPKDLDPSYKMDLDLWDCLGRVKLVL